MVKRLLYFLTLLVVVLLSACSDDTATDEVQQPLPDGMGCIRITVCTPENNPDLTRAVNEDVSNPENRVHDYPWEAPDHDWEKLKTFRIFICDTNNKVVQIITGGENDMKNTSTDMSEHTYQSAEVTSQPLDAGTYRIYATANYDDGYSVGSTINLDETVKFANGYSETNIPMTGKLTDTNGLKTVSVVNSSTPTDAGTLTVWRVIGKMQFEFTNQSSEQIEVLGVEVYPINQASADGPGIYLFSKDDLTSTANLAPWNESTTTVGKGVTATWALNDNGTITTPLNGIISETSLLTSAQLTLGSSEQGSKLTATGSVTAEDEAETKLQKFKTTENIENKEIIKENLINDEKYKKEEENNEDIKNDKVNNNNDE